MKTITNNTVQVFRNQVHRLQATKRSQGTGFLLVTLQKLSLLQESLAQEESALQEQSKIPVVGVQITEQSTAESAQKNFIQ